MYFNLNRVYEHNYCSPTLIICFPHKRTLTLGERIYFETLG